MTRIAYFTGLCHWPRFSTVFLFSVGQFIHGSVQLLVLGIFQVEKSVLTVFLEKKRIC
jgi:hypothetical protein